MSHLLFKCCWIGLCVQELRVSIDMKKWIDMYCKISRNSPGWLSIFSKFHEYPWRNMHQSSIKLCSESAGVSWKFAKKFVRNYQTSICLFGWRISNCCHLKFGQGDRVQHIVPAGPEAVALWVPLGTRLRIAVRVWQSCATLRCPLQSSNQHCSYSSHSPSLIHVSGIITIIDNISFGSFFRNITYK